jgi:hypothetical protein
MKIYFTTWRDRSRKIANLENMIMFRSQCSLENFEIFNNLGW